jgi:hypothetical protein
MKNILFTLFILVFALPSFSQTEKKHFLIGGSLSCTYDKHIASPDPRWQNKVWNAGLYPRIGYFVANNIACGIALIGNYGRITQIRPDLPNTHLQTNEEGAGVFGRYYLRKDKDALIAELAYTYDRDRDVTETLDNSNVYEVTRMKFDGQNNIYSAGLGYTRFLSEKAGLEIMANYRYRWDHAVPGHNNFASESWSNGVTLGIGFQFYL